LAANKNFTYGGFFEPGDKVAIVSTTFNRLQDVELTLKDYFVFDNKRFDIVKINVLDYNTGWILQLRNTKGIPANIIHNVCMYNRITFTQEVGVE
jgi:hypothetical protein